MPRGIIGKFSGFWGFKDIKSDLAEFGIVIGMELHLFAYPLEMLDINWIEEAVEEETAQLSVWIANVVFS